MALCPERLSDEVGPLAESPDGRLVAYLEEVVPHAVDVAGDLLLGGEPLECVRELDDAVAVGAAHPLVHHIQKWLLDETSRLCACVFDVVGVDDADDVFELGGPRGDGVTHSSVPVEVFRFLENADVGLLVGDQLSYVAHREYTTELAVIPAAVELDLQLFGLLSHARTLRQPLLHIPGLFVLCLESFALWEDDALLVLLQPRQQQRHILGGSPPSEVCCPEQWVDGRAGAPREAGRRHHTYPPVGARHVAARRYLARPQHRIRGPLSAHLLQPRQQRSGREGRRPPGVVECRGQELVEEGGDAPRAHVFTPAALPRQPVELNLAPLVVCRGAADVPQVAVLLSQQRSHEGVGPDEALCE
mmetsp:Transcript_40044/g.100188  ORF Transcript_40044/g.100188 Transcript_40044/m.100188 type:complete len:360 (+) Transcript_40044:996-2075(+)